MENPNFLVQGMNAEQAKALEAQFSQMILMEFSGGMGYDVQQVKIVVNLKTNKTTLFLDEKPVEGKNKSFATIEQFDNNLRPCVNDEAKRHGMTDIQAMQLEVKRGSWLFEVVGKNAAGEKIGFNISPISIIPYAMKK